MKSQGRSEQEIISALKEKGLPPRTIQDALNQASIKSAVAGIDTEEMQQSIMGPEESQDEQPAQDYDYQSQAQYPQYSYPQQESYTPQEAQNYYQPQQNYYSQENYSYSPTDASNFVEIAEQVVIEKMKRVQKQLEDLNEFKILAEARISSTEERLKRIESMIDQLQISIIEKIGSYGQNLSSIKKEMSMMQDSFSKIINDAVDSHNRKR